MRKIQSISIPRSGHHLLVSLLRDYFGSKAFKYCEYYLHPIENCCKSMPCKNAAVTFSKSHDFFNKESPRDPIVKSQYYLVQYRYFLESLVSDYSLYTKKNEKSLETWRGFSAARTRYYKAFVKKWVIDFRNNPHFLFVPYNELIESPILTLSKVISFFVPNEEVNFNKIAHIVEARNIKNHRSILDFEYFNFEYFAHLEKKLFHEIFELGLKPRFYDPNDVK